MVRLVMIRFIHNENVNTKLNIKKFTLYIEQHSDYITKFKFPNVSWGSKGEPFFNSDFGNVDIFEFTLLPNGKMIGQIVGEDY